MMTFVEIGRELGVTHQRAQQIYAAAMRKLLRDPAARALLAEFAREARRIRDSRALRPEAERSTYQIAVEFKAFLQEERKHAGH